MTDKRKKYLERQKEKEIKFKEYFQMREIANRKSDLKNVSEEIAERQEIIESSLIAYRNMLPTIVNRLGKISDYRNPLKIKYKLTVLLAYGILMFVFKLGSRRETNRKFTKPIFWANLKLMFPEIEAMPHADTLYRLLENIEVEQIEETLIELFKKFIRKKKFKNYLYNNRYLFAIDGTQKHASEEQWDNRWLTKRFNKNSDNEKIKYSVYVLECVFVLENGVTLPLYSEFLDNGDYVEGENKQDCETKAAYRLLKRIKKDFPKLKISLTLDGIFASGKVINLCRKYRWDFMITFKKGRIPTLFEEARQLMKLELKDNSNVLENMWGEAEQRFIWVNDIEYIWTEDSNECVETINVVKCIEKSFKKKRGTDKIEEVITEYVWISDNKITSRNVLKRANFMGRYRWCIENNFLMLKTSKYGYKHFYAFSWNAMKGYHYLMNIGRFMNQIMLNTEQAFDKWCGKSSITAFIENILNICGAQLIDEEIINRIVKRKNRLKLVII